MLPEYAKAEINQYLLYDDWMKSTFCRPLSQNGMNAQVGQLSAPSYWSNLKIDHKHLPKAARYVYRARSHQNARRRRSVHEGSGAVFGVTCPSAASIPVLTPLRDSSAMKKMTDQVLPMGVSLPTLPSGLLVGTQERGVVGLQESDIRLGLNNNGFIRNIVVVTRPAKAGRALEYVIWVHPSWLPGLYPFCSHRGRSMRAYKDLNLLFAHCREKWGYRAGITVRISDDPKVAELRDHAERRAARRLAALVGNEALLD